MNEPSMRPPSTARHPAIAITMGDPAGIGPELCLRALTEPAVLAVARPVVVGDADLLRRVAQACGLPPPESVVALQAWRAGRATEGPVVVDCGGLNAAAVMPGMVNAACGRAAAGYIEVAVEAAREGRVAAIATAPINKAALHAAGVPFPGHTEMLAALTGATRTCMMLACDELAVSLVTIHIPLAEVPRRITAEAIRAAAQLTAAAMRRLKQAEPRLVVCGLNPHAGEGGLFGREEADVIQPAVEALRQGGLMVDGPLPPDTAFLPARRERTDAYIVMYHDQGLIPLKMLAFDRAVNITLGLPIIRTSVDHGTAFDLAWKGVASPNSLFEAVRWAVRLAAPAPAA